MQTTYHFAMWKRPQKRHLTTATPKTTKHTTIIWFGTTPIQTVLTFAVDALRTFDRMKHIIFHFTHKTTFWIFPNGHLIEMFSLCNYFVCLRSRQISVFQNIPQQGVNFSVCRYAIQCFEIYEKGDNGTFHCACYKIPFTFKGEL